MSPNPFQLISLLRLNFPIFGQWEPLNMSILIPEIFNMVLIIFDTYQVLQDVPSCIFCLRPKISHFSKKSWFLLVRKCVSRPQSGARNDHCYYSLGPFQWINCLCYICLFIYVCVYIGIYEFIYVFMYMYVFLYRIKYFMNSY